MIRDAIAPPTMTPPLRLTSRDGALLIVDLQEKLLAVMPQAGLTISNAVRLLEAAKRLDIPIAATEQYPRGLGRTVAPILEQLPEPPREKQTFHAVSPGLLEDLRRRKVRHVTLTGAEAHVCVLQTALELIGSGLTVQVAADAVASRQSFDWKHALRRLEQAGAVVSTTEAILFEWLETADHPEFKFISKLVKDFRRPDQLPN